MTRRFWRSSTSAARRSCAPIASDGFALRATSILRIAALLLAPTLLLTDAAAQTRRREPAKEKPRPNLDYATDLAQCGPAYHAALQVLLARPTPQPVVTSKAVRSTMPEMTGRWTFHDAGDRRRARDDRGRLIEGNQVCAEEQSRGGRTRCLRWEARAENADTPVPVPPPSKEEQRVIGAIAELVANKGAPPEFQGNGRYTIMTDRAAADLEGYMTQDVHPAMCSGTNEFVDFFETKLAPLRRRMEIVGELRMRALALIAPRVAALRTQLVQPLSPPTAPPLSLPSTTAGGTEAAPAAGAVAGTAHAAGAAAPPTSSGGSTMPPPETTRAWVAEVAALVLTPPNADAVRDQPTPIAGLRRLAELMATAPSGLSQASRASAKAALRTIEAAVYVEMLGERYRDLDKALFGTLDDVRKAHLKECTCGG